MNEPLINTERVVFGHKQSVEEVAERRLFKNVRMQGF
jgi:hypothetical protein